MRGGQRADESGEWDGSNHPDQFSDFCLSVHDAIYNHFNLQRHLISRQTLRQTRAKAYVAWTEIVAA
jgi:hypothetical protein